MLSLRSSECQGQLTVKVTGSSVSESECAHTLVKQVG